MRAKAIRMTQGQQTALTCVIAGAVCELAMCVALHRGPTAVPLGIGIGAGSFVWIDPNADEYPSWFGATLTVCASIGILISLTVWGV